MRILMLNYEFPPVGGGGATATLNLTRSLVQLGHEPDVVTMGFRGARAQEVVDGVRVYRVPCFRLRKDLCHTREMLTYVGSGLLQAARLARAYSYDINNTHFIFPTGPVGFALRRIVGLPYVLTARGSDVPGHNPSRFRLDHRLLYPAWRSIVRDADAVSAVSNDLKREIQQLEPDVGVTVIPNGVAQVQASRNDSVSQAERARRILVVTRLHQFKGVQYLLQAVADEGLDYEIDIVGDGPYRRNLERQAAVLNGRVRFWGWLDRSETELRDLYRQCGIFVYPSDRESFGIALLEAMSEGMAVVAAKAAAAPEVIGDAGLLVTPRDPRDIARALSELAADPKSIAEYGQRARERVALHFNWPDLAQRYVALYKGVLAGAGSVEGTPRPATLGPGAG